MAAEIRGHPVQKWRLPAMLLLVMLLTAGGTVAARSLVNKQDGVNHAVLHNITIGAVACPYSAIVGWTLGHDWTTTQNVVLCTGNRVPAVWVQLWWRNGKRTSLCADFGSGRC